MLSEDAFIESKESLSEGIVAALTEEAPKAITEIKIAMNFGIESCFDI